MKLAREISDDYAAIKSVEAVVLAGSQTASYSDESSDMDLYVYSREEVSLADRTRIAHKYSQLAETGNQFWEPGDEWIDNRSKIAVDVMFRRTAWIEEQMDRILKRHQASVGYSTCFWHNVLGSQILFDRSGWFSNLQQKARVPYPDELRAAIIAKNYPILRNTQSSYRKQIERALLRQDPVSVNHRLAAFLASYFDVLFAVNRLPHPGEKRLVNFVTERCAAKPQNFAVKIADLIGAIPSDELLGRIDSLVDDLETLL